MYEYPMPPLEDLVDTIDVWKRAYERVRIIIYSNNNDDNTTHTC